ncbi:hypothetical protein DUI87_17905 [Hirundo rustica rustica]|uniref:Uncharacterized protein n=1 Tax=Hirundo rustica rustica TaxID=333673 RepID=A0A3M0K030_HIRRU|nr:hypothetical protein DUI87_17905 [Hirundo rustica rustica]
MERRGEERRGEERRGERREREERRGEERGEERRGEERRGEERRGEERRGEERRGEERRGEERRERGEERRGEERRGEERRGEEREERRGEERRGEERRGERRIDCFCWKGRTMATPSDFLTSSGLTMVQPGTKALPKILLNTNRLGAWTKSLESLFQCLTKLSVKKCFVMFHLTSSSAVFNHSHTITGSHGEELSTSLSTTPPQEAIDSNGVTPQPPFL